MRKKFIAVYALMAVLALGSTTLTSCVDDNESASVTAIRDAKAKQLASIADLNTAQAEAVRLAAQAEADLKAAKAAYQQALADGKQEKIRQAQEKFALEIEKIKAEYDAQIAEYKKDKIYWDNEVWKQTEEHIQTVYNQYFGIVNQIQNLTREKLEQQTNKALLEAEVIKAEEAVKQQLASLNIEKIQKERELAKWEAMKEMQPTKDDLLAQLDEIEKKAYDIIQNKRPAAAAEQKTAQDALTAEYENFEEGKFDILKAEKAMNEIATELGVSNIEFIGTEDVVLGEEELDTYYDENGEYQFENAKNRLTVNKKVQLKASELQNSVITINKEFTDKLKTLDDNIKNATGEEWETDDNNNIIWGSEEESVNGAKSRLAYQKQSINAAEKRYNEAKKLYDAAVVNKDEAEKAKQKAAMEQAAEDKANLEASLPELENKITAANEKLAEAKENKTEMEEMQTEFEANLAILKDASKQKAYDDAFAKLDPLAVTFLQKTAAVKPFDDALEELGMMSQNGQAVPDNSKNGEYQYVQGLLNNIYDVQSLIDGCNTRLAEIKAQIELGNLNQVVELAESTKYDPLLDKVVTYKVYRLKPGCEDGITPADAVALVDELIKTLDEKIQVKTKLAEKYKANLEALLESESAPEEPETPAEGEEGGEETPAE